MLTCFMRKYGFLLLAHDDLILFLAMVYIDFKMCMSMSLFILFNLLKMYAFDLVKACLYVPMDSMDDWVSFEEMRMNVMHFVDVWRRIMYDFEKARRP